MWETLARYGVDVNFIICMTGMIAVAVMWTHALNQVERDNDELFEMHRAEESQAKN